MSLSILFVFHLIHITLEVISLNYLRKVLFCLRFGKPHLISVKLTCVCIPLDEAVSLFSQHQTVLRYKKQFHLSNLREIHIYILPAIAPERKLDNKSVCLFWYDFSPLKSLYKRKKKNVPC